MTELERALLAVGQNLEVPAAPDLTGAVRARLAEGRRPSLFSRRVLVVALAVLAVAVGAVLAVPQARSTIKDWLGIGNVTIRYVDELPPVEQATGDLGLGEQMSLEEARERAGFRVRVPTVEGLDDPPKVYYNDQSRQVAFLYGSEEKPKLLITQADARGAIEKIVNLNVTERELDRRRARVRRCLALRREARDLLPEHRPRGALQAGRERARVRDRRRDLPARGRDLERRGSADRSLDALTERGGRGRCRTDNYEEVVAHEETAHPARASRPGRALERARRRLGDGGSLAARRRRRGGGHLERAGEHPPARRDAPRRASARR